ncbi:MAG TPA: hypothetical protein VNK24_00685 [Elusimicrobiota bacterium]|nr:hypothetical protein [Elusimicrobiota bacterium]
MGFNEADTRAKLIDPAIHENGWTEDFISREETAGAVEIVDGKHQPVAVALIEAKAESLPLGRGLEQAKAYAACKRLNVPFVFSSNGHLFVEFDGFAGSTSEPRPLRDFPSPEELLERYEKGKGFKLTDAAAKAQLETVNALPAKLLNLAFSGKL